MRVVLKALKLGQVLMSAEDTTHSKDWQERILEGGGEEEGTRSPPKRANPGEQLHRISRKRRDKCGCWLRAYFSSSIVSCGLKRRPFILPFLNGTEGYGDGGSYVQRTRLGYAVDWIGEQGKLRLYTHPDACARRGGGSRAQIMSPGNLYVYIQSSIYLKRAASR